MGERTALPAPPAEDLKASPAWERALAAYDRELATRGASPATRRAYARDLLEVAAWATERGREPGELAYRDLRAYAAALSERRLQKTSLTRKVASVRGLHRYFVDAGVATQNPADLL